MIGTQQARIIGILRIEFLRDANSFLTIKQILEKYVEKYPDHKHLNYKTIATILRRLSEQKNHPERTSPTGRYHHEPEFGLQQTGHSSDFSRQG